MKEFTTQGVATVQLASGPISLDGARWHLITHVLDDTETRQLGFNIQSEFTRQLNLDRDWNHRSFSWKLLRTVQKVFQATSFQGDTALTIPPFFNNAWRGEEKIWGEKTLTTQPMVVNWGGLNDTERLQLKPILSSTDNWILLTQPLGASNKTLPPLR